MVNWTTIIEAYKKNSLIDLEKLLLFAPVKNPETTYIESSIGWGLRLYVRFVKKIRLYLQGYQPLCKSVRD